VHAASVQDRSSALVVLRELVRQYPTIRKVWVDAAYTGPALRALARELALDLEVVRRSDDRSHGRWRKEGEAPPEPKPGFEVLPRRWVVERTLAWLGRYRRLSKDYEALIETSEAMCWWASLRLLLGRLTQDQPAKAVA
jgi:transposase